MFRKAILTKEFPTTEPEARTFETDGNGNPNAEIHWIQAIWGCTDTDIHGPGGWRFVTSREETRTFDKGLNPGKLARTHLLPIAEKVHSSLNCHEPINLIELKIDGIRQVVRN